MGKSYKPGVEYTDGSYTKLIGYYVEKLYGQEILFDDMNGPAVYLS